MPTASGRRSGAVGGEKSPKTLLACFYCYGNTLYIVNLIHGQGTFANLGGVCSFFFFLIHLRGSVTDFWHLFEQPKYIFVSQQKLDK